jgi:phage tail sheath protein FI
MGSTPTYPGVYIQEVPSAVRTIVAVATSITAFIGRALRGPSNQAVVIFSIADFERQYGGLWVDSTLGYSVQQFFLNGGSEAIIVRVVDAGAPTPASAALFTLAGGAGNLGLQAANEGAWGNQLRVRVDWNTRPLNPGEGANTLFNLSIKDHGTGTVEVFRNVSVASNNPRFVTRVLEQQSQLVRVTGAVPAQAPTVHAAVAAGADPFPEPPPSLDYTIWSTKGSDGNPITDADVVGDPLLKTGIYALDTADLFNLLCIPPLTRDIDVAGPTLDTALAYCVSRRAMLIVDSPSAWVTVAQAVAGAGGVLTTRDPNAALFFPRVRIADPLKDNMLEEFAPSGTVAGIFARTDATRGVWKAPAGQDATLAGVQELVVKMTDPENGQLNPLAVNCLRSFPVIGSVIWGSRTMVGADLLASQWKYTSVRRTALYLEESLYRGTQWAVFEPNDEPLWAQLRLNISAFMQNLFRKGAFQGSTPREAYLVKCDSETTTQNDIDLGIVNILVGFAPLKPAEFVIIKIQQLAGNVQA